jgi:hypothetical protein
MRWRKLTPGSAPFHAEKSAFHAEKAPFTLEKGLNRAFSGL